MSRVVRGIAVFTATLGVAVFATPSGAAAPCAERVLLDWSDNGRVDKLYPLHCYDDAIAAMPADLRDYTDASEVIKRALATAVQSGGDPGGPSAAGVTPDIETRGASSVPIVLFALGGLALLVLGLGSLGFVVRRLRGRHEHETA